MRATADLLIKSRAIDASIAAMAIADSQGRITYANPAFLALWGYDDVAAVMGRSATEFWTDPAEAAGVIAALATAGNWVGSLAGQRRDGFSFRVQVFAQMIRDPAGEAMGMVASFVDLSDRLRVQEQLRENEERLRLALAGTNQGLFDLNLQTGATSFSPEYATMLGYDPATFRLDVETWEGLLHPADRERAHATLSACIAGTLPAYAMECRLRTRSGAWEWIHSAGKVVAHDATGRPLRLIGTHIRITERKLTEQALRESEYFLSKSQQVAQIGSYKFDLSNGSWIASASLEEIFGIPSDFAKTAAGWLSLVVPEQRDEMEAYLQQHVLAGRNRFEKEYRIRRPSDGQERWVFGLGELELDAAGLPVQLYGTIQDTTARKQAEEEVHRLLDYNRGIFDSLSAHLCVLDATGRILSVNQAWHAFAAASLRPGANVEVGANYLDACWHATGEARIKALEMAQGIEAVAQGTLAEFRQEYSCDTCTQQRWFLARVTRFFEAGNLRIVIAHIDISERMQAHSALRASEARLAEVFANMDDVVFLLNVHEDGRFTYESFNPRCEQITGLKSAEVCGRSPDEVLPPDNAAILMPRYRECRDTGAVQRYETELAYTPGRRSWSTTLVPIRNEQGRVYRIAGFGRDITERRKAEQERLELERRLLHTQKLESLGVLAGGIAHDFNNLLTAILGNLDLGLIEISPYAPARARIEQSMLAARRAADLTRQMLAYSGRGSFLIRSLNLSALVEENAHLFRACISKLVTLIVETTPNLPAIKADAGQIQQVVMNLITNASEANETRPGVVRLRTGLMECDAATLQRSRTEVAPPAGPFVFLEVMDTGCGMDEPTLQRLFDPFFTTKFTGRGLGMSAILGIVRGHEGAIFVDSTSGRGTTIRVLFPVKAVTPPLPASLPPSPPAASPPNPKPSGAILVVDDEQIVRRVCGQMLARAGWRILEAEDGVQAVEVFRQHAADIAGVILDLSMPRMGGIEAFRALRQIRPDVRVILSSGYSDDQRTTKMLASEGLAGFIQKPYTTEALAYEVEQALRPR
jgi:PAS domain S-box-containing protein